MTDTKRCLHCDQTKAEIKRDETFCGLVSGYEYQELTDEWPRHRWADWKDSELPMIRPEFRDLYRRTQVTHLQWVACEHSPDGHRPATSRDVPDFVDKVGQCILCGKDAA
jgi:hypothetical protein